MGQQRDMRVPQAVALGALADHLRAGPGCSWSPSSILEIGVRGHVGDPTDGVVGEPPAVPATTYVSPSREYVRIERRRSPDFAPVV